MTRDNPGTASTAAAAHTPKVSPGSQPSQTAKPAEYSVASNGTVSTVTDRQPTHLLVLANGIGSCAAHWANMKAHLDATLGDHVLIHVSTTNQGLRTQQGIDVCGEITIQEIFTWVDSLPPSAHQQAHRDVNNTGFHLGKVHDHVGRQSCSRFANAKAARHSKGSRHSGSSKACSTVAGFKDNKAYVQLPPDAHVPYKHAPGGTGMPASLAAARVRVPRQADSVRRLCAHTQRLASEIRLLAESHRSLSEVSVLGHSMGGLIARAAAGLLFDPASGTIAGMRPAAYVSLVSPHLGITCADTQAQLPFIVWGGAVWGVGGLLRAALKPIAGAVASLMSATTRQFFGLDACSSSGRGSGSGDAERVDEDRGRGSGHGDASALRFEAAGGSSCSSAAAAPAGSSAPLLVRLCVDEPSCGRLCFSALAAFRVRVAYSVVSGDQWVRWANGAIAREHELPLLRDSVLAFASGVVHEHDEHDDAQGRWPRSPADNAPASTAVDHASVGIGSGVGCDAPAEPSHHVHAAGNPSMPRRGWDDATRVEFIVSQLQQLRWRRVSVSFRGDSLLGGVPHHRVQARSSVRSRGADAVKTHLGGLMAAYLGGERCGAGDALDGGNVCDAALAVVRAGW